MSDHLHTQPVAHDYGPIQHVPPMNEWDPREILARALNLLHESQTQETELHLTSGYVHVGWIRRVVWDDDLPYVIEFISGAGSRHIVNWDHVSELRWN